jgi:hypothetical protein
VGQSLMYCVFVFVFAFTRPEFGISGHAGRATIAAEACDLVLRVDMS